MTAPAPALKIAERGHPNTATEGRHTPLTAQQTDGPQPRAPFYEALAAALARRGLDLADFCPQGDCVAARVLEEYGAMFLAEGVELPSVCIFETGEAVRRFQEGAGWSTEEVGGATIELQPRAMKALLEAREEALAAGLDITPRGGVEAARRSFEDSLRLWRSRCDPALEHWCASGSLAAEEAERVRGLPLREQVAAVLELERGGLFFSKCFAKSILQSVAAPGASQHLAMLAFDALQFRDPRVREIFGRRGWFQTVRSDLPHFTYLGLPERELPARGLRPVEEYGQQFWVPDIGRG